MNDPFWLCELLNDAHLVCSKILVVTADVIHKSVFSPFPKTSSLLSIATSAVVGENRNLHENVMNEYCFRKIPAKWFKAEENRRFTTHTHMNETLPLVTFSWIIMHFDISLPSEWQFGVVIKWRDYHLRDVNSFTQWGVRKSFALMQMWKLILSSLSVAAAGRMHQ